MGVTLLTLTGLTQGFDPLECAAKPLSNHRISALSLFPFSLSCGIFPHQKVILLYHHPVKHYLYPLCPPIYFFTNEAKPRSHLLSLLK